MPKGSVNPAHGNNLSAFIADINHAWRFTPLSHKERRAVVLRHGFDLRQADIADIEECAQSVVATRLFTAIGKLVAQLNGTNFIEGPTD